MPREALVIGKTGVGKTAFVLGLAEFLNMKKLEISFLYPDGHKRAEEYRLDHAKRELIGSKRHRTRCLQSIAIELPAGKGKKILTITDSPGLVDGIHEREEVRRAMAQTLGAVRRADVILHVVDVGDFIGDRERGTEEVDKQIAEYASLKGGYVILANKMDLPGAAGGLQTVMDEYIGRQVIPVSVLQKKGFVEVKAFVWRYV